jgi:hypothetical protein
MCSSTVAGLTIQLAPIGRDHDSPQLPDSSAGFPESWRGHSARGFGPAPPADERYEKERAFLLGN